MASGEYAVVLGVIAFDPTEREVGDDVVIDLPIRDVVSGEIIRTTVWPGPLQDYGYTKGELIAVDGKLKKREVKGTTYYNMDAYAIHMISARTLTSAGKSESEDEAPRKRGAKRAY